MSFLVYPDEPDGQERYQDQQPASAIQRALQLNTREDLFNLLVMHSDGGCTILQVIFDHSKLNGLQVLQIVRDRSKKIMDVFFSDYSSSQVYQVDKDIVLYQKTADPRSIPGLSSMQQVLHAHIFQAPYPQFQVREIYKEIFRLFASDFFLCIDVSHLFAGEPCILRISFYWSRDFDEQWDEMIALKKSRDMVMCSWSQHLQKQRRWASHLPQLCPEFLPIYGDSKPLRSVQVRQVAAVAFTLRADRGGCFFCVYEETETSEESTETADPDADPADLAAADRFQNFQRIFQLEPSRLQVRDGTPLSARL